MPRLKPPTGECRSCQQPVTREDGHWVHWNDGLRNDEAAGHVVVADLATVPTIICGHCEGDPEDPKKVVFV